MTTDADIVERMRVDGGWLMKAKHASAEVIAAGRLMIEGADEIEHLRAVPAPSWRDDMENAPKDGTWILLRPLKEWHGNPMFVGHLHVEYDGPDDPVERILWKDTAGFYGIQCTHWMPLPPPPQGEAVPSTSDDRHKAVVEALRAVRAKSDQMAEDEGLWFQAETCAEAYVQAELRKLCAMIESLTDVLETK